MQQSERPEEGHLMSSSHYRNGNPWGGLSYADLITAAILSAKNKRMTLEQIYQWLVSNVPYFGDKGDDSSRVGWKVSKNVCFTDSYNKKTAYKFRQCKRHPLIG